MFNSLKSVLSFFAEENNLNILFLTLFALSVVGFLVFLALGVLVQNFGALKKTALIVLDTVFVAIGISLSSSKPYLVIGYVFLACLNAVCCYAVFCVSHKRYKSIKEQKEFVKYIDQEIKKRPEQPLKPVVDKIVLKPKEVTEKFDDLNYSHVKNILERLDFFPLTQNDKKQVRELRVNLNQAESGNKDAEIKKRINDGLGDLLKIMSKYGV